MADSFSKKENFKKKLQKQKEKAARREERKENNNKGKELEDMFLYVDANGQLTSTPPNQQDREEFNLDDIQLGAAKIVEEDPTKKGIVTFLSEKGYGFITEEETKKISFSTPIIALELSKKATKFLLKKSVHQKVFLPLMYN